MSTADRNKVIIAAAVVVVALVVIVFMLRGRRRPQRAGPAGGFGAAEQAPAAPPGEAPAPPPGTTEAPAAPEAAEAAVAEAGLMMGAIRIGRGTEVRTRQDPLLTFDPPPQPVPPELVVNPPPVTLQPGGIRPRGIEVALGEEAAIGQSRVSGLLFDEGAYAILENAQGQAFVVKPGDVVEGNRITAIARDSIFLIDSEGERWQVRLRGKGPVGSTQSARAGSVEGMPEVPVEAF